MKLEETSLTNVGNKVAFHIDILCNVKEKLPALPKEDIVDGYITIKDMSKKIDKITALVRDEVLTNRLEDFDEKDEKGHRYFNGSEFDLKVEKRVSTKLNQIKARAFFEEKGLMHKVSDVQVSLSTEEVQNLLRAAGMLDTKPSILASIFGVKAQSTDVEKAAIYLDKTVQSISQKGVVTINEDKISALISLEELSIDDIAHLYESSVTYALKEKK